MKFYLKTPNQRLLIVLNELSITPYKLSKILGYKSPDTVYNIINEKNEISDNFINRIKMSELSINIRWLTDGFGDPINLTLKKGGYGNEIFCNSKKVYPCNLDFYFLKEIAMNFATVIGKERDSYSVEVKKSSIYGLEFRYKTFSVEKDKLFDFRYYSILLSLDWKISSYFECWNIYDDSRRCQNLLEFYPEVNQRFINALYPIQNEIIDLADNCEEENTMFDDQPIENTENFIPLYSTDSRIDVQL